MKQIVALLLVATLCFSAAAEFTSEESDTPFYDSLTPEQKYRLSVNFHKFYVDTFKNSILSSEPIAQFGEIIGNFLQKKLEANTEGNVGESKYLNYFVLCPVCHGAMSVFNVFFDNWLSLQFMEVIADKICEHGGLTDNVCNGAVNEFGRKVQKTLATGYFSPRMACSYFLPVCHRPHYQALSYEVFQNQILANAPAAVASNTYISDLYTAIKADPVPRKTYKLLHISDLHVDPKYEAGYNAQCNEPLCCRKNNGYPTNAADAAKKWGNYNCDLPTATVDVMLDFIKTNIQPDALVWTGDNVPHNVWDQTVKENIDATVTLSKQIKALMPNIIALPVIGNHEAFPVNMYNFEKPHQKMLEHFGAEWESWIGKEAVKQFKEYGYYEVELPAKIAKKAKFIGLHSNACNNMNFFFFAKGLDPGHHIQWLEQRLALAEQNGETIFLAGHIPTSGCLNEWAFRYRALIERYQNVVRGEYYGHYHHDRNYVTRSVNSSKPIGLQFCAGSMTTYTNINPSFRVYTMDSETNLPLNYQTYYIDLEAANANEDQTPQVQLLYSALEDMNLPDLSPQSFDEYLNRLKNDEQTAMEYIWWNNANSANTQPTSCDAGCRNYWWCDNRNTIDFEQSDCLGQPRIDFKNNFQDSLFEVTLGPWFQETKKGI